MLLSRFGILSIELQRAIRFDQGVAKDDFTKMESVDEIDESEVEYVDSTVVDDNTTDEKKIAEVEEKFKDFTAPKSKK